MAAIEENEIFTILLPTRTVDKNFSGEFTSARATEAPISFFLALTWSFPLFATTSAISDAENSALKMSKTRSSWYSVIMRTLSCIRLLLGFFSEKVKYKEYDYEQKS